MVKNEQNCNFFDAKNSKDKNERATDLKIIA